MPKFILRKRVDNEEKKFRDVLIQKFNMESKLNRNVHTDDWEFDTKNTCFVISTEINDKKLRHLLFGKVIIATLNLNNLTVDYYTDILSTLADLNDQELGINKKLNEYKNDRDRRGLETSRLGLSIFYCAPTGQQKKAVADAIRAREALTDEQIKLLNHGVLKNMLREEVKASPGLELQGKNTVEALLAGLGYVYNKRFKVFIISEEITDTYKAII